MRLPIKAIAIGAAVVAGGIQLIPYGRDHDNPPVVAEPPWPSETARELAVAACYDCHSRETEWPWYSYVAPMSWLVQRDVEQGREALDLSAWDGDGDDAADAIADGEMPPTRYVALHPAARLSDAEKALLIAAFEQMDDLDEGSGRGRGRGRGGDR